MRKRVIEGGEIIISDKHDEKKSDESHHHMRKFKMKHSER